MILRKNTKQSWEKTSLIWFKEIVKLDFLIKCICDANKTVTLSLSIQCFQFLFTSCLRCLVVI